MIYVWLAIGIVVLIAVGWMFKQINSARVSEAQADRQEARANQTEERQRGWTMRQWQRFCAGPFSRRNKDNPICEKPPD